MMVVGCTFTNVTSIKNTVISEWAFGKAKKIDSLNPILLPSLEVSFTDPITNNVVYWESRNVLNPTALVKNDTIFLLYRAQDALGTSRIGLAYSLNGTKFSKYPKPVFYPDHDFMFKKEWNYRKIVGDTLKKCQTCYFDGVEDPRVVQNEEGRYFMTYTSYDGKTARLSIASTSDLFNWKKHGLVLKDDKYINYWSKSGAIVSKLVNNNIVATKIDGKYWMYFGDTQLFMATSDDLVAWTPVKDEESQKLITVLNPRPGYFDSRLVEPGPFALLTEKGIKLIYNASNAANYNDVNLPKYTYAAGQALFNSQKPYKLLDRKDDYFIFPDKSYEKVGEVNEVCFVEGLVFFKGKWFLYYGTADSKIAVAILSE